MLACGREGAVDDHPHLIHRWQSTAAMPRVTPTSSCFSCSCSCSFPLSESCMSPAGQQTVSVCCFLLETSYYLEEEDCPGVMSKVPGTAPYLGPELESFCSLLLVRTLYHLRFSQYQVKSISQKQCETAES